MKEQPNNGRKQYQAIPYYNPVLTPYSMYGQSICCYPNCAYHTEQANYIDSKTTASPINFAYTEENVRIMAKGIPSRQLLTPTDHILMLMDHQPQMAFATESHNITVMRNNAAGLAKTARLFGIPTILTTVAAATFSGKIIPEVQEVFPEKKPIDRTTMNSWEDPKVVAQVNIYGREKIVMAGLWTEVCLVEPVLSAIEEGYKVYFITDASGGVSKEAHDMAVIRMTQAGAIPMTWMQYLLELQRDWARKETYEGVLEIVREHGGAYGLGVIYAEQMFGIKKD